MESQINHFCKCLHLELRKLQHVSGFPKLDFCNILLSNLPYKLIDKLQMIWYHAARLVTKSNFTSHISPSLIKLHLLPVKSRLKYKFVINCVKCAHCNAPLYISHMLKMYIPMRNLSSLSELQLCTKNPYHVILEGRGFSIHGPSFWNNLPFDLRSITTITKFKVELKTYLFKISYIVQLFLFALKKKYIYKSVNI